jgi:hypothetical protein
MRSRWIIRNWTVRCTLETMLAGGATGALYGVLLALITSGGSAPAGGLDMGVVGLVLGLVLGLPLGLINGLGLGVLTRWRFAPLRELRHYRRSIAIAGCLLNAALVVAVGVALLAAASPDDRRAFWSGGLGSFLLIIAVYVPVLLAYASAVVVDLRWSSTCDARAAISASVSERRVVRCQGRDAGACASNLRRKRGAVDEHGTLFIAHDGPYQGARDTRG